jgi:hypothetical protein
MLQRIDRLHVITNPEDISLEIALSILEGETVSDVFDRPAPVGTEEVIGQALRIQRVRWMQSQKNANVPIYALIEAVDADTGEKVLITCGATNVVAQLIAAEEHDWLPLDVMFTVPKDPTARGYYPVTLRKLEGSTGTL